MTDLVGRSLARDDELPLAHPRAEAIDDRTGIPWINAWTDRRRQRRAERAAEAQTGMDYLISTPRRVVTIYLPLSIIVFVLLFPFYWMFLTAIKPNAQLVDMETYNPYWVAHPTLQHIKTLLFETYYLHWMWNTMMIAVVATFLSLVASVLAAYAIVRIRYRGAQWIGGAIFLAYLVPPSILFIPLSLIVVKYGLWDSPLSLILTYPTILIPFSTWLLMGYFKSIPFELEECALIDGASRMQILTRIILPLSGPGLISAGIFAFTLCWNEFIYALTFISSPEKKTVPTAIISEFVDGDIYRWGSLMAGALLGSVPVAIVYMFFVNHYVQAMTGAVKE
jgi:multiple sugar transport system permease protein